MSDDKMVRHINAMNRQPAVSLDLTVEQYQRLQPVRTIEHQGATLTFSTPTRMTMWRAVDFASVEPATLAWLEELEAQHVLVDVGANVGSYALWAAKARSCRVFAFEPESQNYAVLCQNIMRNGLDGCVSAFPVALSDVTKLSVLHLSNLLAGDSCHAFDRALQTEDARDTELTPFEPAFSQGCVALALDQLIALGVPVPHYLKIDVDGFEDRVIAGAQVTLERRETASLLIETNPNLDGHQSMIAYLEGLGYGIEDRSAVNYIFRR